MPSNSSSRSSLQNASFDVGSKWWGARLPTVGVGAPSLAALAPRVWVRGSGITEVSGDVASITDEGSEGLTFAAPTAPERPAVVTVGSLVGWQHRGSEYLNADSTVDLTQGILVAFCVRWDTIAQVNTRFLDFGGTYIYLASGTTTVGGVRQEHASGDITSVVPYANGDVIWGTAFWGGTGNTSELRVMGVSQGTVAGTNTIEPAAGTIAIGARADGVADWQGTMLTMACWDGLNDASYAALLPDVEAYLEDMRQQAAGTTKVHLLIGQSLFVGNTPSTEYTSINGVDYTVPYPQIPNAKDPAVVWSPLDDSGAATGTGPSVSMGRELVRLGAGRERICEYSAGGVGIADMLAFGYSSAKVHFDQRLAQIPGPFEIVAIHLGSGEADAFDAGETAAAETNTRTLIETIQTDYAPYLATDHVVVIKRMAETYQTILPDGAGVNAGFDAYAATVSNCVFVDVDIDVFSGDGLHPSSSGTVGLGRAHARAAYLKANATAVDGDNGT